MEEGPEVVNDVRETGVVKHAGDLSKLRLDQIPTFRARVRVEGQACRVPNACGVIGL